MFGLFDGACDFGLDGAGDPMPGTFPEHDMEGRRWNPVAEHYRWPSPPISSDGASWGTSGTSESSDEIHDLDGPGHNHPGVVLDKYGRPYAQRVPYYNSSADRRPREDNQGRRSSPEMGHFQGGVMSAQPIGRGEQVIGYAPDGTPMIARPTQQQPQGPPTRGQRQHPNVLIGPDDRQYVETLDPRQPQKVIIGSDGQQYIAVSGQQQPQAYAPCAAAVTARQRETLAPSRGAVLPGLTVENQQASPDHSGIPEGFVAAVDSKTGELVWVPPNVAKQYAKYQQQQRQVHQQQETTNQQQQVNHQRNNNDTEHHRSIIFKIGHKLTRAFGHDYRLIAAAVPHLPFFQKYSLADCTSENVTELQRQLNQLLSHRHFPNGDRIVRMHDPRDDEAPDSKTPTKKHPAAPEVIQEKAPQQQVPYDDTAQDLGWVEQALGETANRGPAVRDIATEQAAQRQTVGDDMAQGHEWFNRSAGEYADINKAWREERHKAKGERKKRHDERHKKRQENEELKKTDEEGRHSSRHSESTLSHWSSTITSVKESQKGDTGPQNEDTKSHKSKVSSSHGWGNGATGDASTPQAGGWDDPNNQNDAPPADNNAQPDPNPPTDGNNDPQPPQAPYNPPPYHNQPPSTRSSQRSPRSTLQSTTTSRTINPNAAIQPYFDVRHPNNPNSSNSKPDSHQTPIPRTPYVYPPTQAPHLSSSVLGNRSHGVRAGKGAEYTHATLRPKYLDTMERPYAVFVFEYRSVEKLEQILGRRGEDLRGDMDRVQDEVGLGVLMGMPKEKLVEELMKARENAERGGGEAAAAPALGFLPPMQEMKTSTHKVNTWNNQQQPYFTAVPAAPAAAEPALPAPAATHSHHSHGKKSENKSKKAEQPKAPSVQVNLWGTPAGVDTTGQQDGGGGFADGKDDASALNKGAAW